MADTSPRLEQSVRWGERYVSSALNRKLAGVLDTGVYHGFVVSPGGGLFVRVDNDPDDYPVSVAVVERGIWSITITMTDGGLVEIPGEGTWYVVIEAYYSEQEPGYQRVVARQSVESHHLVIAKITVAEGQATITDDDISFAENTVRNEEYMTQLATLQAALVEAREVKQAVVEADAAIAEGVEYELPDGLEYLPGVNQLMITIDGLHLYSGIEYEEVAATEDGGASTKVKFLFDVEAGSQLGFTLRGYPDLEGADISLDYTNLATQVTQLRARLTNLANSVAYIGNESTGE